MASRNKTLDYLLKLALPVIRPGLSRTKRLLKLIDNPEKGYPTLLIGGTNGKGSTLAMLLAVLRESGLKVGSYTSPHIERFNERIKVDGSEITGREITRIAGRLKGIVERELKGPLKDGVSFFEFTTVLALEYFRERGVDIALLEVGMGGRFDSTNVVLPEVSIITTIGLDHKEFLGTTLAQVAVEKAGIIKPKGVVVVGGLRPTALKVVRAKVRERSAKGFFIGKDFAVTRDESERIDFRGDEQLNGIKLALRGEHQLENAACALKALEVLRGRGFRIPTSAIRRGLKGVSWPGRIERFGRAPKVILDVAHNVEGAKALVGYLSDIKESRVVLVLGIMEDKDVRGILKEFASFAETIILTAPQVGRSCSVDRLKEKLDDLSYRGKVIIERRVSLAVKAAMAEAKGRGVVCVSGSIYTVAEARRYLKRSS